MSADPIRPAPDPAEAPTGYARRLEGLGLSHAEVVECLRVQMGLDLSTARAVAEPLEYAKARDVAEEIRVRPGRSDGALRFWVARRFGCATPQAERLIAQARTMPARQREGA